MSCTPDRHPVSLAIIPFRCPACHDFSDQRGHFVAPRKFDCKGWDLLRQTLRKDPDSNCITKEEYEEALAAAKAQKVCKCWKLAFPLTWALAPAGPHLSLSCRGSERRRSRPSQVLRRQQLCQGHAFA